MVLFVMSFLGIMLASVFYIISFIASFKVNNNNKFTAFESGFSVVGSMTSSFSIHFFMVVLVFVIFELEVVLLVGVLYSLTSYNFMYLMFFILGSMYLEYSMGKLSWMV